MSSSSESEFGSAATDSRLREFLIRAAPVLAEERGWNERSRLKLKSLSDDLNLPDALYERALDQLKVGETDWTKRLSRYEKLFVKGVRNHLAWEKTRVLSSTLESKIVRAGVRKYQLTANQARDLLHRMADELGMSRVSYSDAEENIKEIIGETIGTSTFVSDETTARLYSAGQQWGVDAQRVESLIHATLQDNHLLSQRGPSWRMRVAAAVVAIIVVVIGAYLASQLVMGSRESGTRERPSNTETGPDITASILPSWASPETRLLLGSSHWLPRPLLIELSSNNSDRRHDVYQWIVNELLQNNMRQGPSSSTVDHITLLAYLVQDEQEPIDREIIQILAQSLNPPTDRAPRTIEPFQRCLAANEVLKDLYDHLTDPAKKQMVNDIATEGTGESMMQTGDDYLPRTQTMLCKRVWQRLLAQSFRQPSRVASLVEPLEQLTSVHMGDQLQRHEFSTVMTLLQVDPTLWRSITGPLTRIIDKADLSQCSQLLDQIERTKQAELTNWLTLQLAKRLDVNYKDRSLQSTTDEIRRELGISVTAKSNQMMSRWKVLEEKTRSIRPAETDSDSRASPQTIANLAYCATLAGLLNQAQRSGEQSALARFDQMLGRDFPTVSVRSRTQFSPRNLPLYGQISRRAVQSHIRTRDDALDKLQDFQQLQPDVRALAFSRICSVASRFADVTRSEADIIVAYMLNADQTPDILAIEKHAPQLSTWANVALALADQIPQSDCTLDHAVTVTGLLIGRDLEVPADDWRKRLRDQILERVSVALLQVAERRGNDVEFQWDELERVLFDQYRIRCAGLGVPGHRISSATSVTDLIEELAQATLRFRGADPGENETLRRRFQIARSLNYSQVQQTVLAQQQLVTQTEVWIHGHENPSALQEHLTRFWNAQERSNSITMQLLLGEMELLDLWSSYENASN